MKKQLVHERKMKVLEFNPGRIAHEESVAPKFDSGKIV